MATENRITAMRYSRRGRSLVPLATARALVAIKQWANHAIANPDEAAVMLARIIKEAQYGLDALTRLP
jgi:hypothetical protein